MRRNYRYGESWNDLHTQHRHDWILSAVSFFVVYTIQACRLVFAWVGSFSLKTDL